MKILHVYKTSLPDSYGGVESFIDALCKSTGKLGVENELLTLHPRPLNAPIKRLGYTIHQCRRDLHIASTGFSVSAFRKFGELATKADIIHHHFPNPFADLLHITSRIKKPTLVTYHSDIVRQKLLLQIYKPLRNYFLDSVDHIASTSPNYFVTSNVLQKYSNKVSIIPIGIEQAGIKKVSAKRVEYWQKRLSKPFFLFIGAMRYYKGLHIAIDAISGSNINLVIAGTSKIENVLKAKTKALGIKSIEFLGTINEEDKLALLNQCYGFIFPSHLRSEAFGIALLEAAAAGKPMISCEIGTGTSFINVSGETGIVVCPGSPHELREAMEFLLANPKVADRMGNNAKKRARALFKLEDQADSYLKVYKKLLS